MPVCTLSLLSLSSESLIPVFLSSLRSSQLKPLLVAKVIRWIIKPTILSLPELLHTQSRWHLFILLPGDHPPLPPNLKSLISSRWSIAAGIPSRLLLDFHKRNYDLLHPCLSSTPSMAGALPSPNLAASSQSLELSPDLHEWITSPTSSSELTHDGSTAVSMLNLLSFHEFEAKKSYLKYGASFAESTGARRGGLAKIVGSVVKSPRANAENDAASDPTASAGWDEIAIAHYPSVQHFGDMLASSDYQTVNQKYRIPSLRDTAILCVSETAVEGMWEWNGGEGGASVGTVADQTLDVEEGTLSKTPTQGKL